MPTNPASSNVTFLLSAGTERHKPALEGEGFSDITLVECLRDQLRWRLTEDHPRLKKTLEDVAWLVQHGSFITAAKCFGEFRIAQERDMNLEDRTLFPIIERLSGPKVAVRRGRANHETIRRLMNAVSDSLSTLKLQEFADAHRRLLAVVSKDWEHEERLLSLELKCPDKETVEEIECALRRS